MRLDGHDPHTFPYRVATRWALETRVKEAGWAGSGYGGTLIPSTLQDGEASRIVSQGGTLHGWDKYVQLVGQMRSH